MMAEAAHRLGVQMAVLDPQGSSSPAGQVAELAVEGSYRGEDISKIHDLAGLCDVLTVEIEHVNCAALEEIEMSGTPVHPAPATVRLIQDKYLQKEHFKSFGLPLGEFREITDADAAYRAGLDFGYPFMLKKKTMAYDGKGNAVVRSEADIQSAMERLGCSTTSGCMTSDCYAERWVAYSKELAVMVIRAAQGTFAYPVAETTQYKSVCSTVLAPAQIPQYLIDEAVAVATRAIDSLPVGLSGGNYGVFGVELFLTDLSALSSGGSLGAVGGGTGQGECILVNEVAPRPHNSGHYTIEACDICQVLLLCIHLYTYVCV
jgi:phosphoribosylaminoimidazole carboxylase